MNRELYIHTLSQFRDECERKHMDTETEAFNTVIQALSAEWDCISRRDVLDWLENGWDGMVLSLFDGIKTLPSAQPETPPYVAEIECEYKKWVSIPHIRKPLAKALYEVWKKHDREDVSRNG